MIVGRAAGLALLLVQSACTVTAVNANEDLRPRNSCSSSDGCGEEESCVEGLCQSLNGELEAVLLTATPDVDSDLPQLTYVTHLGDLPSRDGSEGVVWPGASVVTGSIELPKSHCYPSFISEIPNTSILKAEDGTLPAAAVLTLRQRVLGLSQQTYLAKTVDAPVMGYTFALEVPSGEYDVYLAPPTLQMPDCVIPPQLFRRVSIGVNENSNPPAAYRFQFATISKLVLRLLWPESSRSLQGWSADIIEARDGNPISTRVVLDAPSITRQGKHEYVVQLSSSAVADGTSPSAGQNATDLLRLRPPVGLIAPTIYLERSALGLLQDPEQPVDLSIFTQYPAPVSVQGQMTRKVDGSSVAGTVTLVSKEIYGIDAGVPASYQTQVAVAPSGVFDVVVPPGRYAVQAQPKADQVDPAQALSNLETEWIIPADTLKQFGKLLQLPATSVITGQSRIQGAQIEILPVPRDVLPFEDAYGIRPFTPRPAGAYADDSGRFSVRVDAVAQSRVSLTLRPPDELGYAWFVRTGLVLEGLDQDMGRVVPPLPSVLSAKGSVLQNGEGVPLAFATIRAYAYLDEKFQYTRDPSLATSVVQVAETRADETGAFRLLLPSSIDAP
jgi:hypothetical protein